MELDSWLRQRGWKAWLLPTPKNTDTGIHAHVHAHVMSSPRLRSQPERDTDGFNLRGRHVPSLRDLQLELGHSLQRPPF